MQVNSCEVCCDLIPLVADDVAEPSSKEYVIQHINHCESCRQYYRKELERTTAFNDEVRDCKVMHRLYTAEKKRLSRFFWGSLLLVVSPQSCLKQF